MFNNLHEDGLETEWINKFLELDKFPLGEQGKNFQMLIISILLKVFQLKYVHRIFYKFHYNILLYSQSGLLIINA